MVLQRVERRFTGRVECDDLFIYDDLSIYNGIFGKPRQCFGDDRIPEGEVIVVARPKIDFAAAFYSYRAIAVKFYFIPPKCRVIRQAPTSR